ncbi:unnamed protein product [Lathyrus sativus]|nr:unnamed protein product [Lathyrus sativus]
MKTNLGRKLVIKKEYEGDGCKEVSAADLREKREKIWAARVLCLGEEEDVFDDGEGEAKGRKTEGFGGGPGGEEETVLRFREEEEGWENGTADLGKKRGSVVRLGFPFGRRRVSDGFPEKTLHPPI